MVKTDYLIIGGSAAGTTSAEVIRRLKPDSFITVVSEENHEQYSKVLMPHYVRHKVPREQVFLKKPDWYKDIELVKGIKAVSLESKSHKVKLSNGEVYQYGKLLIAIGGDVIKLNVPGGDLENILYMRTIEDGDEIVKVASSAAAKALADKQSAKAVIVGGGFIGLEFCSCFKLNGVSDITALVLEDYYWQGKLDEVSSNVLVGVLTKNNIKIVTNAEIERIEPKEKTYKVGKVITKSGHRYECDVVGVGIGIKSGLSWLEGSGIKVNQGIVTNQYLETNVPDIYAAGDCAEFWDVIFERQHIMGNWANATSQGLAVGKTMAGQRTVFETASSYSINFFDQPRVDERTRVEAGGSCSFIGVTDEKFADEVISRGSVEAGKMARIFIKTINGSTRIVGATIINDPAEVSPITFAVKNKTDVSKFLEKLADQDFSLKEITS